MHEEDQMAPIKRDDIRLVCSLETSTTSNSGSELTNTKQQLVAQLLSYLNEKRDSYNGVINSIIYVIDSEDEPLIKLLKENLRLLIKNWQKQYGGKMFISRCLPRLINERPEFVGDIFAEIQTELLREYPTDIKSDIMVMKVIHQVEQKTGSKVSKIENRQVDRTHYSAILHGDEATKIEAMYIMLDTKSATKVLESRELIMFQTVFKESLDFQVPALRQKFLAITNKMLKRMRDSIRVVKRDSSKYSPDDQATINTRYMDFLKWLIEFCIDNIYCNKYFGSFIITMTTLSYVIEHVTLDNPSLHIAPFLQNRRFYDSILSCLALDSFEDNKKMALKLLFAMSHADELTHESNLNTFERIAYELVNSVNPAHSLTCQYVFKLLIGTRQNQSQTRKNTLVYGHLDRLVRLVETGLQETREDFILALKTNAIYPKLTCIRALLDEINVEDLEVDREKWEQLVERLVKICIESSETVSSIVCNMNPETIGHLPMDLKPIDASMLSVGPDPQPDISPSSINTITSQHLLITGWKTIKECSLSLGTMCRVFWWPEIGNQVKKTKPVLRPDQIEAIVSFFEHNLRNLRHRGAFEQAYNGFIMVTKRIWLDPKLKQTLLNNLTTIIHELKSGRDELDDEKVDYLEKHVTRRSAGLPFLVQAIAVSEHRNASDTLRIIMESLIAVSNCPDSEAYQKIHCLNILKALMNDFNLGEKVTPYIGQVLLITIDAFGSDNFSIRNCANMLMRVLVDRTFGVSRLREEVHKRNTLSYEKFFTDYPDLHGEFQIYLESGLSDRRSFASVHAVFIVLSRLRPSLNPSKEFSVSKVVAPFIGPTLKLARSCPDFKLRELAARILVQLEIHRINNIDRQVQYNSIILDDCMSTFLEEIADGWHLVDRNRFHGNVCILQAWQEYYVNAKPDGTSQRVLEYVKQFIRSGLRHLSHISGNKKYALRPDDVTLWTIALDLIGCYAMVKTKSALVPETLHHLNDMIDLLLSNIESQLKSISHPSSLGPMFENLIFKMINIEIGMVLSKSAYPLERIAKLITRKPDRIVSVNLQAAIIRLLRQPLCRTRWHIEFIDQLMDNLYLDSTAAHMTLFEKLHPHSELDPQRNSMLKYCSHLVSNMELYGGVHRFLRVLNLTQYDEFKFLLEGDVSEIDLTWINTPRATELLALVFICWKYLSLKENYIWPSQHQTMTDKLKLLVEFLQLLPDCDIKPLALLCASRYLEIVISQIFDQEEDERYSVQEEENECPATTIVNQRSPEAPQVVTKFTRILEDLADGQHDRMIRKTCCEILDGILINPSMNCNALKEAHKNLLSALIKLCQDEIHEIRQDCSKVIVNYIQSRHKLRNGRPRPRGPLARTTRARLSSLINVIASNDCTFNPDTEDDIYPVFDSTTGNDILPFFNPNKEDHVLSFFELVARVIFSHSRASLIDVNEERESLFDKTKPNTFADHVATIQETLTVASKFFRRAQVIDVNLLRLSPEIAHELSSSEIKVDHTIGDYSWRLIHDLTLNSPTAGVAEGSISNRTLIDTTLRTVIRSLSYFTYWNMLTDTSFGYHESAIFKKLAFVRFVASFTNYENTSLLCEIRDQLGETVAKSCATTILSKCHELLCETDPRSKPVETLLPPLNETSEDSD